MERSGPPRSWMSLSVVGGSGSKRMEGVKRGRQSPAMAPFVVYHAIRLLPFPPIKPLTPNPAKVVEPQLRPGERLSSGAQRAHHLAAHSHHCLYAIHERALDLEVI